MRKFNKLGIDGISIIQVASKQATDVLRSVAYQEMTVLTARWGQLPGRTSFLTLSQVGSLIPQQGTEFHL